MVGFNPGLMSWQQGHYYANPRNYFYPLMHKYGITPRLFAPHEDVQLPSVGIGMVDVLKEPSARSSDIPSKVFVAGRDVLIVKLEKAKPRIVCFNGAGIYSIVFGRTCKYGMQEERIGGAPLYVVPSTSPANNGKWQERERCFAELGEMVRREQMLGNNLTPSTSWIPPLRRRRGAKRRCGIVEALKITPKGKPRR